MHQSSYIFSWSFHHLRLFKADELNRVTLELHTLFTEFCEKRAARALCSYGFIFSCNQVFSPPPSVSSWALGKMIKLHRVKSSAYHRESMKKHHNRVTRQLLLPFLLIAFVSKCGERIMAKIQKVVFNPSRPTNRNPSTDKLSRAINYFYPFAGLRCGQNLQHSICPPSFNGTVSLRLG